jgi:hypothetical protein
MLNLSTAAAIAQGITSQISARKGGSFLFLSFNEKQTSEFWLPSVRSSVRIDSSFAKMVPDFGRRLLSTYAFNV